MRNFHQARRFVSPQFLVLSAFLILAFLTGGGARGDIQSLIVLRPVAVLVCGYSLWTLTREQIDKSRFLLGFAIAIFLAVGLHLVPLPPSVWHTFPGRDLVVEIDRTAQLGAVWRPLSLMPPATWNALYSLFVPLAVLLLAIQLQRDERFRLLYVLVGLGIISGLLGVLQIAGTPGGALYFYEVTNAASAVGLFANRNHAGLFLACLFPMLAVYASTGAATSEQLRHRTWTAIAIGVVLVPLIMVTGSRAALICAVLGLATVPLLYRQPRTPGASRQLFSRTNLVYMLGGVGVFAIGAIFMLSSRAESLQRLLASDQDTDSRLPIWGPAAKMAWGYFPFGSGFGTYVEAFQVNEPASVLSLNYSNHAHNDWLELYMTGGLAALALLAIAIVAVTWRSVSVWRASDPQKRGIAFPRMASVVILLLALGSAGDYPLRVPSLMCFFVIAVVWLHGADDGPAPREESTSV